MVERGPIYDQTGKRTGRITFAHLQNLVRLPIPRPNPLPSRWDMAALHAVFVSKGVMLLFFGRAWVDKNAAAGVKSPYLRATPGDEKEWGEHIVRSHALG